MSTLLILIVMSQVFAFPGTPVQKHDVDLEIAHAVFLYQIGHCYRERSPELYFISYNHSDPTDALLERFKEYDRAVYPRSQMQSFWSKQSGQRGVLLAIASTTWLDNNAVAVKGSCVAGSLDAYSYVYRVERKNRKWVVTKRTLKGVS